MDLAPNTNQNAQAPRPRHHETPVEHIPFMRPTVASKILVILLIVASVVFIASVGVSTFFGGSNAGSSVKSKQYQALFLTNGQVYFGKLSNIDGSWVKLSDIYYLQVQQTVQPKDSKAADAANPQVSLAKLGNELHGPEDQMYVDRSQVLFWENLKDSGKVVAQGGVI